MALREAGNGVMLVISVVSLIYLLAIIIPNLAVAVRRLHDSNLSGCLSAWFRLLVVSSCWSSMFWLVLQVRTVSDPNPNTPTIGTMM